MKHTILRILLGAIIPIPLAVASFFIVCDIFYFNKDSDYIRLCDSRAGHIAIDFIWYLLLATMFFGLPCLLYSAMLEWRRRNGKAYIPVSLVFGGLFGLIVGYLAIPSQNECRLSHIAEGCSHFFVVFLIIGVFMPALLQRIARRHDKSEPPAGVAGTTAAQP
jgi:hypothetical protein